MTLAFSFNTFSYDLTWLNLVSTFNYLSIPLESSFFHYFIHIQLWFQFIPYNFLV